MKNKIAAELERLVNSTEQELKKLSSPDWETKPGQMKWTKKEILGHLIDSAQNNLRRFVVSQYQQNDKIFYHQDEWVQAQAYQQAEVLDLITLWELLNKQLARTLRNIPLEKWQYTCDTGKTGSQLCSLEYLATDYIRHLNHHLNQIFQR